MQLTSNYNPDVLTCLANLSNDEVFTPPTVVNQMLDMLPAELFRSSKTTFLDPVSKSGVFLREIAKRLMIGLEAEIPDVRERANHIFTRQLFGISITELTSFISRRSVYCSKAANGRYSLCTEFKEPQGNIRFRSMEHTFVQGKCKYCGASEDVFGKKVRGDLESHAYEFIHNLKNFKDMKFDVIIGNPPYQLGDGGNAASALPIYHMFIQQAKKLNPRYMSFIVPARWLNGGRGLDDFRKEMLEEEKIKVLHDYLDSKECFSGVEIKGGVCFFLWERDYKGMCNVYTHSQNTIKQSLRPLLETGAEIFIRSEEQVSIYHKVLSLEETSLATWLNAGRYFGFHTKIDWDAKDVYGTIQSSDGKDFYPIAKERTDKENIKVYIHGGECWIDSNIIPRNADKVTSYKVLIPRSGNPGFGNTITGKPKISEPNSCSSNTYMVAIPNERDMDEQEAHNLCSYIKTKFARFLVATKTSTQSTPPDAFQFVPLQDFSHPWTDAMLYDKYGLTDDEIAFIESMIRPME